MIYSTNLCCGTCGRHRLILTFISDKSVIFLINKDTTFTGLCKLLSALQKFRILIQNNCAKLFEYQFFNVFLHVQMYILDAQGKQKCIFGQLMF